jgi:hypothetical protein
MTAARAFRSSAAAALALAALAAFPLGAQAGNFNTGSLASEFLQSKTEMTILSHDDLAAPNCAQKQFIKATPNGAPASNYTGAVEERKWTEQWTLNRCGIEVNYWVFFTVVGMGGAYYAIVDPPVQALPGGDIQKAENQK